MLKLNAAALALAIPLAAATAYMDALAAGPPWPFEMYALDVALLVPCWHVLALATLNIASYVRRHRELHGPLLRGIGAPR